jgi:hypothetical protein
MVVLMCSVMQSHLGVAKESVSRGNPQGQIQVKGWKATSVGRVSRGYHMGTLFEGGLELSVLSCSD